MTGGDALLFHRVVSVPEGSQPTHTFKHASYLLYYSSAPVCGCYRLHPLSFPGLIDCQHALPSVCCGRLPLTAIAVIALSPACSLVGLPPLIITLPFFPFLLSHIPSTLAMPALSADTRPAAPPRKATTLRGPPLRADNDAHSDSSSSATSTSATSTSATPPRRSSLRTNNRSDNGRNPSEVNQLPGVSPTAPSMCSTPADDCSICLSKCAQSGGTRPPSCLSPSSCLSIHSPSSALTHQFPLMHPTPGLACMQKRPGSSAVATCITEAASTGGWRSTPPAHSAANLSYQSKPCGLKVRHSIKETNARSARRQHGTIQMRHGK